MHRLAAAAIGSRGASGSAAAQRGGRACLSCASRKVQLSVRGVEVHVAAGRAAGGRRARDAPVAARRPALALQVARRQAAQARHVCGLGLGRAFRLL